MKTSKGIQKFFRTGICISTALADAVQMVAVVEAILGLGLIFHGTYLCALEAATSSQQTFGALYTLSGITFWVLTWIVWIISKKPTLFRCRVWILTSILNQLLVLILTVTRNEIEGSKKLMSANIWIACGLFLQFYMTAVVWSFMLNFLRDNTHHANTDQTYKPTRGEDSSVSMDDSLTIDKNSTVVSL